MCKKMDPPGIEPGSCLCEATIIATQGKLALTSMC